MILLLFKIRVTGKRKTELELLVDEPYYIIGSKKILEKDLIVNAGIDSDVLL